MVADSVFMQIVRPFHFIRTDFRYAEPAKSIEQES